MLGATGLICATFSQRIFQISAAIRAASARH
jgi:hypothetical protein